MNNIEFDILALQQLPETEAVELGRRRGGCGGGCGGGGGSNNQIFGLLNVLNANGNGASLVRIG